MGISSACYLQRRYPGANGLFQPFYAEADFGLSLYSTGRNKECVFERDIISKYSGQICSVEVQQI